MNSPPLGMLPNLELAIVLIYKLNSPHMLNIVVLCLAIIPLLYFGINKKILLAWYAYEFSLGRRLLIGILSDVCGWIWNETPYTLENKDTYTNTMLYNMLVYV